MEVDPLCFGIVVAAGGTGNIARVEGRMDSTIYQEIQEANVQKSVQTLKLKRGWEFQQDDDQKHTSLLTMKYLQERQMKVLEWPPQPQTFVIENLWRSHTCHTCKEAEEYF